MLTLKHCDHLFMGGTEQPWFLLISVHVNAAQRLRRSNAVIELTVPLFFSGSFPTFPSRLSFRFFFPYKIQIFSFRDAQYLHLFLLFLITEQNLFFMLHDLFLVVKYNWRTVLYSIVLTILHQRLICLCINWLCYCETFCSCIFWELLQQSEAFPYHSWF